MKRYLKISLMVLLTTVVVAFDVAILLAVIARSRGVEAAAIPSTSLIETLALDADYAGGFRVPVSIEAFSSTQVLQNGERFGRGMQVSGRGPAEVVYRGRVPGLQYHVGYSLEDADGRRYLTVTTVFHYSHALGRLYGPPLRLSQWGAVPFMVGRLAD